MTEESSTVETEAVAEDAAVGEPAPLAAEPAPFAPEPEPVALEPVSVTPPPRGLDVAAEPASVAARSWEPPLTASDAGSGRSASGRPELVLAAGFGAGLLIALILKRLAR